MTFKATKTIIEKHFKNNYGDGFLKFLNENKFDIVLVSPTEIMVLLAGEFISMEMTYIDIIKMEKVINVDKHYNAYLEKKFAPIMNKTA